MITRYLPKQFLSGHIDSETIKVGPISIIRTTFLVMASDHKLPRPSFKSYVSNISLCEACFLKVEISIGRKFGDALVLHTAIIKYIFEIYLSIICIAVGKNEKENMEGLKTTQLSTVVVTHCIIPYLIICLLRV